MSWWLLSVRIADMACVARRNVKLKAGRRTLCEGRKELFQKLETGALLTGGGVRGWDMKPGDSSRPETFA